jgi:hypothetical protein
MLIHWTLAAVHLIADHRGGHGHGAGGGPMVERWEGAARISGRHGLRLGLNQPGQRLSGVCGDT